MASRVWSSSAEWAWNVRYFQRDGREKILRSEAARRLSEVKMIAALRRHATAPSPRRDEEKIASPPTSVGGKRVSAVRAITEDESAGPTGSVKEARNVNALPPSNEHPGYVQDVEEAPELRYAFGQDQIAVGAVEAEIQGDSRQPQLGIQGNPQAKNTTGKRAGSCETKHNLEHNRQQLVLCLLIVDVERKVRCHTRSQLGQQANEAHLEQHPPRFNQRHPGSCHLRAGRPRVCVVEANVEGFHGATADALECSQDKEDRLGGGSLPATHVEDGEHETLWQACGKEEMWDTKHTSQSHPKIGPETRGKRMRHEQQREFHLRP
eukprot:7142181-Prymnesium_polylepis.1